MRYLGIDWGSRNIGLAVSDETANLAFPLAALSVKNIEDAISQIKEIVVKENISQIIIGLPRNFKQENTGQTKEIQEAAKVLENALALSVVFQDEIFTSKMAELHSEKNTHSSAAALILQAYLDKEAAKKHG